VAAIRRVTGGWIAVHSVTGKRLKGQPRRFRAAATARAFARRVCRLVTGRRCPVIRVFRGRAR
jgi:hypothetical protein